MKGRRLRSMRLVVAALTACLAACGAILGIEDRTGEPPAAAEAGTSADAATSEGSAGDDGATDLPLIGDAQCTADACGSIGGSCIKGACVVRCDGTGCDNAEIVCPPDVDCQIACVKDNACKNTRCRGGRSCTLECANKGSCQGATCSGTRCAFDCQGPDQTCLGGIGCDASTCLVECKTLHSCDNGVSAVGATSCTVACTGESSCGGDVSCTGHTSSIVCGSAKDACRDGRQTCSPAPLETCSIACQGQDCRGSYCCDGGVGSCSFDPVTAATSNCK